MIENARKNLGKSATIKQQRLLFRAAKDRLLYADPWTASINSGKKLGQRQLVRDTDVLTRAESHNMGVMEMSIFNAQHVGAGGNRGVKDRVVAGVQEHVRHDLRKRSARGAGLTRPQA